MKKMSIFAMLLAAVVVTSYSVSGTYAKYTSTFTGADTARVAKWAFTVNDTDMTTANNQFTFDLFATVIDANVKEGTDAEAIIAPGTQGSFKIGLANASDVNAKYSIDYTVAKTDDIPVQFTTTVDGEGNPDWSVASYDLTDVAETNISINGEAEHTVYWRWVFESGNDGDDTALGVTGDDTITVTASINAVQVD